MASDSVLDPAGEAALLEGAAEQPLQVIKERCQRSRATSVRNDPAAAVRRIHADCRATIGAISNAEHMGISLGKAGRKRWLGRKPHNRGVSMNPVSHPMGGGEGRTSGGRHPCSPTGVPAKGGKTRKKRKPSNSAIVRRRKPGPRFAPR